MIDPFKNFISTPVSPAENCFAITPSDSEDLPEVTKALYIGLGGNVTLRSLHADADVEFLNVPSGAILDVRTRAVRLSGTTASNIVGLA